jgi:hypothetical protein
LAEPTTFTKPLLYQLSYVGAGGKDYIQGMQEQEKIDKLVVKRSGAKFRL